MTKFERIEKLLAELRYEVEVGMLQGELEEEIGFQFIVPVSRTFPKGGVVMCEFRTRPVPNAYSAMTGESRLKVVK